MVVTCVAGNDLLESFHQHFSDMAGSGPHVVGQVLLTALSRVIVKYSIIEF